MTDDETLTRLFAADAPPARDPAFVLAVTAAMHRRRLYGELASAALTAAAAAAVLWVFGPLIGQTADWLRGVIAPLGPVVAVLLGVGLVFWAWPDRPHPMGGGHITAN